MKKLFALLLCFVLSVSMAACGGNEENESGNTGNGAGESGIEVDVGLLFVEITLPAWLIEFVEELGEFNPDEFSEEHGFDESTLNEDGSFTAKILRSEYNEMIAGLREEIDGGIKEMIGSEFAPYIDDIVADRDYGDVSVHVDRNGYESAFFEITPIIIGLQASMFRALSGDDPAVTIKIIDSTNMEIIEIFKWPEE